MEQIKSLELNRDLKPLCPRDNHVMHYEPSGIRWKDSAGGTHEVASYHCGYSGCSVRYNETEGYFTVIDEPDVPYFVEEPGTNLLRCARHNSWMYRSETDDEAGQRPYVWRCGVDDCDYAQQTHSKGVWLRQ